MLFRFSMPPMFVMMRGFAVMMRGSLVMRRRLVMMFAGGMFCFGHDVSSLRFICPLKGASCRWGRVASDSIFTGTRRLQAILKRGSKNIS
jgi:hypothetical protein